MSNTDQQPQNSQTIYNATIEQEISSPAVKPQTLLQQPLPVYAPQPIYPQPHPYPPNRHGLSDMVKWLLLSIACIAIVSNPHFTNILTNMIPNIPNVVSEMTSLWYSSFDHSTLPEVDTTGLKDSIHEIATLFNIDYTPMYQLSISMTTASGLVRTMEHKATSALSHTNIPKEYKKETLRFFKDVSTEMRAAEATADDANIFYHQQRAELDSIHNSLNSMKRKIRKSNIPAFLDQIDRIINIVENQKADLTRIKQKFQGHKVNMQSYNDQSLTLQHEILGQKDVSETTEGKKLGKQLGAQAIVAVAAGTLVNPFLGIGVGLYGMYSAAEGTQRIKTTLAEFEKAADMFQITSDVLADSVVGISMIINNLNEISVNLRQIQENSNMVSYELGELQRKDLISHGDKEELIELIDSVIIATMNSRDKYEMKSDEVDREHVYIDYKQI